MVQQTSSSDIQAPQRAPIFSFADGEMGPVSNTVIRTLERATGQPKIKQLYLDYVDSERPRELFWADALDRLGIKIDLRRDPRAQIPKTGPVLVIANHPFGVVDGLALCALIAEVRQDYKIITHRVLRQAPAVMDKILAIDFEETEDALANNLQTRKEATNLLKQGGVVVIFPSGAISRAKRFVDQAVDPNWKNFVAKLATQPDTSILPFYVSGQNSPLWQVAMRLSQTLGYSLMFREIVRRMNKPVTVTMRDLIAPDVVSGFNSRKELIGYLRASVYGEEDKPQMA